MKTSKNVVIVGPAHPFRRAWRHTMNGWRGHLQRKGTDAGFTLLRPNIQVFFPPAKHNIRKALSYRPENSRHQVARVVEELGGEVRRFNFTKKGLTTWTT